MTTAADVCERTAQNALNACNAAARSDRSNALGKCANISDAKSRAQCRDEAEADFNDAMKSCEEQLHVRKKSCSRLGSGPYDPAINPGNFVTVVDNPYFPLPPGRTLMYEGQTADGFEHDDFIITHQTKVIQGVTCIQVHDLVYLDGVLAEDTLDWFAQDNDGNVWYFGENTGELKDGRFVTLEGSFTAGVDHDKPGIIMEAHPKVGDFYRQEFSLNNAEDFAEVIALNTSVTAGNPPQTFTNCLQTRETTPLEPDLVEYKYYAPGVGNVLTVDVKTGDQGKLIGITTNSE